jgi:23S rRNA (pseudouridine1915-N3)-methyltransferase
VASLAEWRLVAVGRIGSGPEAELFNRYNDRLRPKLNVIEIAEGRGAPAEIKRREADAILAAVPDNAIAVALDLGASAPDSEAFSARLSAWIETAKPLAFIIGGAEGLERRVIDRANQVLSLGAMTWPHMLVRVMLAEQLFRARAIATNHPYHRSGRP